MAIPNNATGAGHANDAGNVFRITFSQALSTAPKYEAWDNSETFPAVDASGSTTAKEIFAGTTENSNAPMLSLYDANAGATTPGANWTPSASAGSANPNRLKGTTNYVTAQNTPAGSGEIRFNMTGRFPSDATVPSTSSCNYLLQIRYTYTGSAPSLAYYFNDGGTETTPSWTQWTPGTHGMRHTNTGASEGNYKLTLATSGNVDTGEIWVTV